MLYLTDIQYSGEIKVEINKTDVIQKIMNYELIPLSTFNIPHSIKAEELKWK